METPIIALDTTLGGSTSFVNQRQATNSGHKATWEKCMGFTSRIARHDKTSVLLLSWASRHDDLGVQDEISSLKAVLGDEYGFQVQEEKLTEALANGTRKPRHQTARSLAQFVEEHDTDRGLLIIYYAGHGIAGSEPYSMTMVGKAGHPLTGSEEDDYQKDQQLKRNGIVWAKVEHVIDDTEADVLLVFDCCEAGRLAQRHRNPSSYFEFMGACSQNQRTRGPGENSFTAALICALKDFAQKKDPFSTHALRERIMEHEAFPKDEQTPVLWEKRECGTHIVLSGQAFKRAKEQPAIMPDDPDSDLKKEYMDLRFHYNEKITSKHVREAAFLLKDSQESDKASWSRVDFHGVNSQAGAIVERWRKHAFELSPSDLILDDSAIGSQPTLEPSSLDGPDLGLVPATPEPSDRQSRESSMHPTIASNGRHKRRKTART